MLTLILIGVTCVVSFLAFNNRGLAERLILWPPAVKRGQVDRLLTHGFIHADPQHLLFNMITLYFFGRVMEGFFGDHLGPAGFVLFYLSAIVVAILPTYFANKDNADYRSLGASGGVSAVLFGFILLNPWTTILIFFVPCPAIVYAVAYVAYSIWSERRGTDRVNHSAHLWGAAYGVAFTLVTDPSVVSQFTSQLAHPHFRL